MRILFLHNSVLEESLGVASVIAVLKEHGHLCDVLIHDGEGARFFKRVEEFNPDIIAFSCTTGSHVWANRTAGEIKQKKRVLSVMGGIHPTVYSDEAIAEENIDCVCVGEGEYPLLELADKLEKGEEITDIKNLWIKTDEQIYKNELRELNDINSLPLPDRTPYFKYYFNRNITSKRFISSLGCPFECSFCQNPILNRLFKGKGPVVRKKTPHRILKEILGVKENYPLELVHFSDDIFATDLVWLEEFAVKYKNEVGLPFNCNIRISCIDEDRIKLLKEAGCNAVTFGLETGNESLRRDVVNKDITNNEIIEKAALLKKYGIKFLTANMIALPGENVDNIFETIALNRKIKPDYTRVHMTKPFKGTQIFNFAESKGLLNGNAYDYRSFRKHDTIYFKTANERETRNIFHLFYILVKIPIPVRIAKFLIILPLGGMYKFIFLITTAFQESRFFRIRLLKMNMIIYEACRGLWKTL